jgi:hypothetical protein
MPRSRGPTSRTTLAIEWQHPVLPEVARAVAEGRTTAVQQREAMEASAALGYIAGEDRRPLLVLRECLTCRGTEDALMSSKEDNERTYLLSRWFRCVKLPADILEKDHPFSKLFPGEKPSHLFIATADGKLRHDLEGTHSRRELWGAMEEALTASYADSPNEALTKFGKILDGLDELDSSLADLSTRYELAIAKDGADSKQVKKLQKEIAEIKNEKNELVAEASKLNKLELKPVTVSTTK